jgi:hypothetical protein
LQENLDLINQKQLEVGAVPSDVTPTVGSSHWVTSGGVFNATNIAHDVDFSVAKRYYVSSNDDSIVSNVNHRSVEVENRNYNSVVLTAGFSDTVPYAISFFSGTPSADTFISGVQSQGNTLYEYKADIPSGCKYIVVSCRTSYTPSAKCYKNMQGLEEDIENKAVKIQMTSFDELELINKSDRTSSSEKQQGGVICINSIAVGGRSGFKFGNILTTDKEYAVEFDIESDSTANEFSVGFANGTNNPLFTVTAANNSHNKIIFTAVDNLNSITFGTTQIGAGKTLYLKNIKLYESIPLDAYCNKLQEEVKDTNVHVDELGEKITQVVGDEQSYTGDIINGFVASGSKEVTANANFATYVIDNDNYEVIHASVGNKDNGAYAVAFYSSDEIAEEGFISGALFVIGQHDYDLEIPSTCKIIVVSSRSLDGNYDYSLSYEIKGLYNRAKIDVDILDKRLTSVENTIQGDDGGGDIIYYNGSELTLNRHSYQFSQLSVQGVSVFGQGLTYANGYVLSAENGGNLRILKYQDYSPQLQLVSSYRLASSGSENHANSLNFGKHYADGDQFPALYVSECYGGQRCFVERVGLSSSTLIQTISLSTVSEHFGIFLNWVPDLNRNRLLAVGVTQDSRSRFNVLEFALPDFTESSITLTDSDILKEFEIANNNLFQGCCICGDMLLLPVGQAAGSQNIIFYDLQNNAIINTLPLSDVVGEPEDCALKDDSLILSARYGFYVIKFV